MGVIERIELVNFMCHKLLTVSFGPQINFVIGHNGSESGCMLLITIGVALSGGCPSQAEKALS